MAYMRKIIVGNWKMHPLSWEEGKSIITGLKRGLPKVKGATLIVCPPFLYTSDAAKLLKRSKIALGVQDVALYENVASKTGSISATMCKESGAQYAIVGHSERREVGESDADVAMKVKLGLSAGLRVILCVGEKERSANGAYLEFIKQELQSGLSRADKKLWKELIIAYEPVWEIGAAEAMTPHDLHQMTLYIRKILMEICGDVGKAIPILYGGSVKPDNAEGVVKGGAVDGLLVGRESLLPEDFLLIAKAARSGK